MTVEKIEKALKLKASPKQGALSLKVGAKKITLPFEVRLINSDGHMFVHIPPSAGLYAVNGKELSKVTSVEDAQAAVKGFRPKKAKSAKKARTAKSMPLHPDLEAALSKIPSGYKLVNDAKGVRLVRTRTRSK